MESSIILEEMKKLRQISPEEDNPALNFAAQRSVEMVCAYCGLREVPQGLIGVCIHIGLWLYDGEDDCRTADTGDVGAVRSIREGQIAVSFQDKQELREIDKKVMLNSFSEELNRFRKMNWKEG